MTRLKSKGVLLLYNHPLTKNAPTILEHVNALAKHSRFNIWPVNSELGFPRRLEDLEFSAIVMHYSLFGYRPTLSRKFLNYLDKNESSYKIAFFQDEYRFCKTRFAFINQYKIDCIFTLVEPSFFKETYEKYTNVRRLVYCLPGYVSNEMLAASQKYYVADEERKIDVGYRGRNLEYYMGRGSQEKYEIAIEFKKKAGGLGLKLDIEAEESKRIYGEKWYRFVANCRGTLGVEAGVSVFDLEDVVHEGYQKLIAKNPRMTFDEVSRRLNLAEFEDRIYYRTISPRHFEAAAFKVCQILFEGRYSGVMKPMVHYIPLRKDFSNFDDVIEIFNNAAIRRRLTDNAFNDLIASQRYAYERFVHESFDPVLLEEGLETEAGSMGTVAVKGLLDEDSRLRNIHGLIKSFRHRRFPGRSFLIGVVRFIKKRLGKRQWNERIQTT